MDEGVDLGCVLTVPAGGVVVGTQDAGQEALRGGRHWQHFRRGSGALSPAYPPITRGESSPGDDRLVRPPGESLEFGDRRDGQHAAVIAAHDLPLALVDHPVMPIAKKDEIGEVSRPAMNPVR